MEWTRDDTKKLTDRILSFSKAESTFVAVNLTDRANLRFARNTATTSGAATQINVVITASFGKRSTSVTVAQLDDESLQRACRRAEEVAKVSPENPEAMPDLGPQTYPSTKPYFDDAAKASPEWRASAAETAIALSKKKDVVSAGFVETQAITQAVASSKGLFAYDRYTAADFNLTSRTPDGSGSGWASKSFNESIPRSWPRSRSTRRCWPSHPPASSPASTPSYSSPLPWRTCWRS
jgi:predicted Zn-dependent protease